MTKLFQPQITDRWPIPYYIFYIRNAKGNETEPDKYLAIIVNWMFFQTFGQNNNVFQNEGGKTKIKKILLRNIFVFTIGAALLLPGLAFANGQHVTEQRADDDRYEIEGCTKDVKWTVEQKKKFDRD
ncbi:hypothetical protein [Ferviditalea candida]|uniref:Uncharacterized protein n=1 Tax=Ferviditalea candida TaxID=3108399 RepID=A0ABU5ZNL2_9BACL|nr:hypothetical protein [Paenibacillaceae bacterium T2]